MLGPVAAQLAAVAVCSTLVSFPERQSDPFLRLVSDLHFVVEPLLFGGGLPLITEGAAFERKLVLREATKVGEGTLRMHYEVRR